MSRKPPPTSRGGVAGMALLFCASAGAVGLGFDLTRHASGAFWLLAQPGGRAALGAGAVLGIVLIAHAVRWLLAHRPHHDKGGRDARNRP